MRQKHSKKQEKNGGKKMKILLVSLPTDSAIKRVVGTTGPPLSLAYLASMVRDEHDVIIVDSIAEELTFDDMKERIKKFNPDVVGKQPQQA